MEHVAEPVIVAEQDREPKKSTITRFEDYLIDDVVKTILSFLDETSRRHLRLVSTKWFSYINYSVFSLGMIKLSEIEEVVRIFGRYDKQIELHFKSKSPKLQTPTLVLNEENQQVLEQLSKLTNLSALTLGDFWLQKFLTLTNLTLLKTSLIGPLTLKTLTKLTKISADNIRCATTVNLPQLEELSISDTYKFGAGILSRGINLKHLTLLKIEHPFGFAAGNTYNKEDFKLLTRALTKLESLTVDEFPITWDEMSTTLTRVIFISNFGTRESNFQSTRLTNLRHLEIRNNIDNLEIFPYLENLSFESTTLPNQVTTLMNLTSLKLAVGTSFSIKILTKLTQLRHLDILKSRLIEPMSLEAKLFEEFTNLTALHLHLEWPLKEVESMTRLTALQELSFAMLQILKTDFFNNLTNITKLYIRQRQYVKNNLGMLTNLLDLTIKTEEKLTLGDTFDGIDQLTKLTSLKVLDKVTNDHWKSISTLTNLKEYVESGFDSTDADRMTQLTVFKNLTKLNTGSSSTMYIMEHMTTLTKLQALHLYPSKDLHYDRSKMLRELPYLVEHSFDK